MREEEQTTLLLKKIEAFSASTIYTNLGSMCVSSTPITKVVDNTTRKGKSNETISNKEEVERE